MALKLPGVYEFAVSASLDKALAIGRKLMLLDLHTQQRLDTWSVLSHPGSAAFSRDGHRIIVKNTAGSLALLQTDDGTELARHVAKDDEGAGVAFSPCDEFIVDASWSGEIRVWEARSLSLHQTFCYPGEMINSVSTDSAGQYWLFRHTPKVQPGHNYPEAPYLTLWRWPFSAPDRIVLSGFNNLYCSSLSPCGNKIALIGYNQTSKQTELRIIDLEGVVQVCCEVEHSASSQSLRWSPDGEQLGFAVNDGLMVVSSETLATQAQFELPFAADLVFMSQNQVLLGGWKSAKVTVLTKDKRL